MRVNLIGNHKKATGVGLDTHILHGLIVHVFGDDTEIRHIPHYYPQCPVAEVNFFIEVITPALFVYARQNIWIPNAEWTYQTWAPYIQMVDAIWVKTREAEALFREKGAKNVQYIGWTSIDKVRPDTKDWNMAMVPVGKNVWRHPKPIIQAYMRIQKNDPTTYARLPEIHIVHSPEHVHISPIPQTVLSKFIVHSTVLPEGEYDALLQKCGLTICLSAAEGFGHAVNEAMSTGSVLLLSSIGAFRELTENALWVKGTSVNHPKCLGTLVDSQVDSLVDALTHYASCGAPEEGWKQYLSAKSREEYEVRHKTFINTMKGLLQTLQTTPFDIVLPKEEDLPKVSVLTLTRDRRPFFPLAKYCMIAQSYPEDKIEWVIVDDGKDQIKDLITDLPNVKYVLVDEPMTIGAKRNLAVQSASHDILICMDDDDVYPNNSILTRTAYLLSNPATSCVFCTTIPCYDIHEKKSFMNVPPGVLGMCDRVSEATLGFKRKFWEAGKFPDTQIAEGSAFIRGREQMCLELSPQDVIVSLTHTRTTSSRKAPSGMEANGCHYGFADELFTLVSEIGEAITKA